MDDMLTVGTVICVDPRMPLTTKQVVFVSLIKNPLLKLILVIFSTAFRQAVPSGVKSSCI